MTRLVRPGRRAAMVGVGILCVAAMVLAGCGPASSPAAPGPSATALAPGSLGPPASLEPGATPLVRIDPSLLQVLPESVDGLSIIESSEGDADASSNASLARLAEGAVGALAIDPASGDFVFPLVVRLKPGAIDDVGFRNWRDSYDSGVCGGTGITGHAQSQIGGRTVYVATCGNGLHTYHVWIADSRLLISASAGGTRNLGELLFGALRP